MSDILDALLATDKPEFAHSDMPVIRYEDITTARVNGKRAIVFPDGRMLGKALDRKQGKTIWIQVGRRTIG
jgi:hypothetical protein